MDGVITHLTDRVERTRKAMITDMREMKQLEAHIMVLQTKIEKVKETIEYKQKVREEATNHLKQLDDQFVELRSETRTLLLEVYHR